MNFKQKLAYMAIGCVFTLAGYFLATLGSGGFNLQTTPGQDNTKQVIDEIVCRKLKIVNDQDNIVVSLEPVVKGGSLSIYNDAGKNVVSASTLSLDGNGKLLVYDKDGIPVSGMFADNTGGSISILKIQNERIKEVATLSGDEIVCRKLRVVSPEGKTIAILGESLTGSGGYLYINNTNDKLVAGIGVSHRNSGLLSIRNKNGKPIAALSASVVDGALFTLRNKNGKPIAYLSEDENGNGVIKTYDLR